MEEPDGISDWQNGYGKDGEFLPGLGSLTQILKQQGYYQTLMVGSDANFGGRKTYFNTHGIDKVYDLYTAWRDGTVPNGYCKLGLNFNDPCQAPIRRGLQRLALTCSTEKNLLQGPVLGFGSWALCLTLQLREKCGKARRSGSGIEVSHRPVGATL